MPLDKDPAFRGVKDKQYKALSIWRIEKMKVVPLDKKEYGKFYSGDSYILLNKNRERGDSIHFWLGKETTRDEAGTAAIKSVELDDILGGSPVQYREVQGHETSKFLSYFKSGIQYQEGGVATGFRKVEKDNIQRLLQVKGATIPRVSVIDCSSSAMNHGDCFILDLGDELYLWAGEKASSKEKRKAHAFMRCIRDDERQGRAETFELETAADKDSPDSVKFFSIVGDRNAIKDAVSDENDTRQLPALYKITDSGGKAVVMAKVADAANAPLKHSMLDTKDCFIVDAGTSVFVWVGKLASKNERESSMVKAEGYLAAKGRPNWTSITRVIEGAELPIFQCEFAQWPNPTPSNVNYSKQPTSRGSKEVKTFDVSTMLGSRREEHHMPDDCSGNLQVWRVEDFTLQAWPGNRYGIFFQGDSYVILYTYIKNNKEQYIIYFWLGLDSSQDEQGAAALLTVKLDDKYGGLPVQQRVIQGKEPEHFLRIFKGKLIIKYGGHTTGAGKKSEDEEQGEGAHLYRVRGTNGFNTRCFEVDLKAASLNSNDVFILDRGTKEPFLWYGKGASGDEREYGKAATKSIRERAENLRSHKNVFEGSEPKEFWDALIGGKTEYMSGRDLEEVVSPRPPRLFHCSNDKGYFYAEEVEDFNQEDLEEDDVMILDTYSDCFLWYGKDCNQIERAGGLKTLQDYVRLSGRDTMQVNEIVVKQGSEPMSFTSWFPYWRSVVDKTDGQELQQLTLDSSRPRSVSEVQHEHNTKRYSYEQLKQNPLPEELEHIDGRKKENYLQETEFSGVFGMSRADFDTLPAWKQGNVKKAIGLF